MPVPEGLKEQFIADCARLTTPALADRYGKAPSTVKEWRTELYRSGELLWWPGIRVHEDLDYDDHMVIEGDCMVVSDLEIPFHDPETLGYMVSIAMRFGIKRLAIAGDFVAVDEYSPFPPEDGGNHTLADTVWSGGDVLKSLFEWFEEVYLIKGNHEQRGSRQKEVGFFRLIEQAWSGIGDLGISFYKWCEVISGGKTFRVEHPGNYSKVPGSVTRDRAEIENENVLGGHTHHCSMSFTKDGRYQALDLGCCTDPRKRYYKTVNGTTRHPKWVRGFGMVRNGFVYLFPVDFTDWKFWLGKEDKNG